MLLRTSYLLTLSVVVGLGGGCSSRSQESPPPLSPPAEATAALTIVADASLVCMVNNTYMGQAQIPVEVEGRTYFGCCPACKERLATDATARTAIDPVTGEIVDKSRAVIARDRKNTVLYFASAENVGRYQGAP